MTQGSKPSGYSADTEILTRRGWLTFDQLTDGDEVATRSPTDQFEWQRPVRLHRRRFDGEMVAFRNKAVDIYVTPSHPMFVRLVRYGGDWRTLSAGYLLEHPRFKYEAPTISWWRGSPLPAEFVIPGHVSSRPHPGKERAVKWLSEFLTEPWTPSAEVAAAALAAGIPLKALTQARELLGTPKRWAHGRGVTCRWYIGLPTRTYEPVVGGRHLPSREVRMPLKAFCSLLGIYLAEGWTGKHGKEIYISQSPKSRYLSEIRAILDATGITWSYRPEYRRFYLSSLALGTWLNENTGYRSWGKYIPPEFKDYPPSVLEVLLHAMMIGDGTWTPFAVRKYPTASKRLADDVQEIFQKLGSDARVGTRKPPPESPAHHHLMYQVFERLSKVHWIPRASLHEYHGDVHAVSVPNAVIYVRRNGKPIWAGDGSGPG